MLDDLVRSHTLPSGKPFDPRRPRFAGTLDAEERAFCRDNAIALAFDPVQQGWVTEDCLPDDAEDDMAVAGRADAQGPGALRFRPWTPEDVKSFRALLDDADLWTYLPEAYPDPLDEDTARTLIEISNTSGHHDVCAIETRGEVVGQVRLAFEAGSNRAEISYWIGRAHWGRGLASSAVAQFTDRGFRRHAKLTEIFAVVHADNTASARVLQKAGYRAAGPSKKLPDSTVYSISRTQRPS
jgi:RimJ/RimL family protein N-acetyltransferase